MRYKPMNVGAMPRSIGTLCLTVVCFMFAGQCQTPQHRSVEVVTNDSNDVALVGPYYALVIGNQNYKFLPPLQTPLKDAESVSSLLSDKFGFKTRLLRDATREQIIGAIFQYRASLPKNSNLLIYYAGHGYSDPESKVAYWLPVDAQRDNNANFISASDISADISVIPSQHILIVSDSCYSGDLSLSRDPAISPPLAMRDAAIAKMVQRRSRNILASGGNEPVSDGGTDGHSIFAAVFLQTLIDMHEQQFSGGDIFATIQHRVGGRSQQLPQYSSINNSGHDGGDFVFSLANENSKTVWTDGPNGGQSEDFDRQEQVNSLLSRYQSAFERRDSEALKRLWPAMPAQARRENADFFQRATEVMMTYSMLGKPEFNGEKATVRFSQELKYKMNGRPQRLFNPQVTLRLKKISGQRGGDAWEISAVE